MRNVAKLAQPLTEGLDTRRYGGRGSGAKKADPRNFYCLLRLCPRPAHPEHEDDSKSLCPFSISDYPKKNPATESKLFYSCFFP